MRTRAALILGCVAIAVYGCSPSTPGGPGTALPESEKPMIGQTENTFTLDPPMMATKLEQAARRRSPSARIAAPDRWEYSRQP